MAHNDLIRMRHDNSAEWNGYRGMRTLAELAGRQAGVLAGSQAKLELAKQKDFNVNSINERGYKEV